MKDAEKTKEQLIHELVERRKQLAELKDSESKSAMELSKSEIGYRQLMENPLVGVWQADTQARFVFINKRLAEMSGYSQDEVIGMSMMVPIAPELRPWLTERLAKHKTANFLPDVVEAEMIRKDGSRYTALVAPAHLYDTKGRFSGFIGSMIDISGRKRAEESLQKARNELKNLVDEKTTELSKTIGLLKREISQRKKAKEKLEHQKKHLESLIKYSSLAIVELDEKQTIVSCNRDFEKLFQYKKIYQDISERKQAEELFRTLFDRSPIGLFIIQDRKFTLINPQFLKLTGYKEDEFIGKDSVAFILPEDRNIVRENTIKMLKREITLPFELRVINRIGETRWIEQTITSIHYNRRPAVLGYYVDITERKQAQEALRESEAKYSALVENSKDGIIIVHDGVLKFINKASTNIKMLCFQSFYFFFCVAKEI